MPGIKGTSGGAAAAISPIQQAQPNKTKVQSWRNRNIRPQLLYMTPPRQSTCFDLDAITGKKVGSLQKNDNGAVAYRALFAQGVEEARREGLASPGLAEHQFGAI
ncbi:MAG TPA: hypothetical protein VMH83_03030 [Candidatus Acidoferrum sp.]|nr:hypothetical protein [Candidatus Acidoferrum sp.]